MIQSKKFEEDLRYIMGCCRDVIAELEDQSLTSYIPWQSGEAGPLPELVSPSSTTQVVQLLSMSFQLLNMIEENTNVQERRARQAQGVQESDPGLWPWTFRKLQRLGFSEEQILEKLRSIHVESVLTAHPTEAKRSTVLEHHRDLYLQLVKRENQMWTPMELDWLRDEIKTIIERLWRTGEIYLQRPDVESELKNMMHYLKNVFPKILPWLDRRFASAWQGSGFHTALSEFKGDFPTVHFGTWVGGDRDGHPFVTADTTQIALRDLRLNALIVLRHRLVDLAKKVSFSDQLQVVPKVLEERLKCYEGQFPQYYQQASSRNPGESWRILINIMVERLPIQVVRNHATKLDDCESCYQQPGELLEDFKVLSESLHAVGAKRIAEQELRVAVRTLQAFGFHSAKLDIRQNSKFHDKALAQLLKASGFEQASDYPDWSPEAKQELLLRELQTFRPFAMLSQTKKGEADEVLGYLRVIQEHCGRYGYEGVGSLIVSMTHRSADLFTMYLLAREAGLAFVIDNQLVCPIPVVPLFETIDDLVNSANVIAEFLAHPVTQASLKFQMREASRSRPLQQVMVGYSDSCKDGGILASQWQLYSAQKAMSQIGEKYGVELCFFHGRGGTVSRGAGPINRFLQALPRGALQGSFRMTEQGETIARKYANFATAVFHQELLLGSFTGETLESQQRDDADPAYFDLMNRLSQDSFQSYRQLVTHPDFVSFFRQATPIDVLEHARIGSRPPKRTGQSSIEDLRAIPWVFSWNQARFYLPSWYGVGSALENLKNEDESRFGLLRERLAEEHILKYVLYNVETTVSSASEQIMQKYASLVEDKRVRNWFMGQVLTEYRRTKGILLQLFGSPIEERRPYVVKTIALRESALSLLHDLQVKQLRDWRQNCQRGQEEQGLEELLLTVNAIAGGLRNTG